MRAYEIGNQQGLQSLALASRPDPRPGPGEALLRVRAVCLNHRDLKILSGGYGPRRSESRTPVSDGIGTIEALGPGTPSPSLGQRAICPHFAGWLDGSFDPAIFGADLGVTLDGWLAERIIVPAAALVNVPDTLSDAQAAPLAAAGLTAWHALVEVGRIQAGDLVLALGTGGVSLLALQIAKMHGARMAITSSSDAKLDAARALGADITINYKRHPDWPAELLRASGGSGAIPGADIIVETGGLATLGASIAAAAPNARIVLIGALAAADLGANGNPLPNFSAIIGKNLTLRGITAGSRRMLQDLVSAAATNRLTPVIDRVFSFEQAAQAYAHLQSGNHFGKVMIELG